MAAGTGCGERGGLEARIPHVAELFQAPLFSTAVAYVPAVVTGLGDIAVMGQADEECGGHLGVAEDGRPLGECEIEIEIEIKIEID